MPPGLQWRICAGKAERKGSETSRCDPPPCANKLIERLEERRRVCGRPEGRCAEAVKANEWLNPSRSVGWVTLNGIPELPSTLLTNVLGKRPFELDKALLDELLHLVGGQGHRVSPAAAPRRFGHQPGVVGSGSEHRRMVTNSRKVRQPRRANTLAARESTTNLTGTSAPGCRSSRSRPTRRGWAGR
jgi:hypothetical protein